MPSIEISPQTFARLQAHAVPLIDNIESVINRLIDTYESKARVELPAMDSQPEPAVARRFSPLTPPDLTHTKILAVELNGQPLAYDQAKWLGLLFAMVRIAKTRSTSPAELKRLVIANYVEREKNDEGFRFLPDVGLSVQAQDSNSSWRTACHIAQQLGCSLTVTFVWRQKEGAAFPGVTGELSIPARHAL